MFLTIVFAIPGCASAYAHLPHSEDICSVSHVGSLCARVLTMFKSASSLGFPLRHPADSYGAAGAMSIEGVGDCLFHATVSKYAIMLGLLNQGI